MDAEGLSVEREIQPIDPLLNKMQLKYQQQAADLELTMKLNPISNGALWYYLFRFSNNTIND